MNELDRELPSSAESERAILGVILNDPMRIEQARRELPAEWLYFPSHRRIYLAMLALLERDEQINSILVAEELKRNHELEAVGGISFVLSLTLGVPSLNLKPYIDRVKRAELRRWMIKFGAYVTESALEGDDTEEAMIDQAIAQLDSVRQTARKKREPATLGELADDQLLRYEMFFKGISNALPTGFTEIDKHLAGGGLVPSGLYILAAQTSIGKTTMALDIGANIAERGSSVYIVSREMSRESLYDRLVAAEADVDRWKLQAGIWETDYRKLRQAVVRLAGKPITLDDSSLKISDVRGYLRERARRGVVPQLVIVDYLQLLEAEGRRKESRNQEVGSISRALKGLAMEFQIPVIAISQLTRSPGKENREPELGDLRDSGEIEQDADAVFFLFGDRPAEGVKFFNRTFKCAKQREGPLFREEMPFDGRLVTYRRAEHFPNSQRTITGDLLDQGEIG